MCLSKDTNEFINDLRESKKRAEGMYVSALYKKPSLYMEYELGHNHFFKNSPWLMYFAIFKNMHKSGYEVMDALSVDSFVEDSLKEKAQERYQEFGRFSPIEVMTDVIEEQNIKEYYGNVLRYSAIFRLHSIGFDIESKWSAIANLDYKQLSDFFEGLVNDVFTDINMEEDEVVNLTDDLRSPWEEAHKGANTGLPVNSRLLNDMIKGQVTGHLTLLAGRSGEGKAMINSTVIPTPLGNRMLGDLKVGDYVYSRTGTPTEVLGVYPQGRQDVYKVTTRDGRETYCNDQHLWTVYNSKNRYKKSTLTLREMMDIGINDSRGSNRWQIPMNEAVDKTEKELPIHPYALGALIGDGALTSQILTISSNDEFVVNKVSNLIGAVGYKKNSKKNFNWCFRKEPEDYQYRGGYGQLITKQKYQVRTEDTFKDLPSLMALSVDKRIPKIYLESSIGQRLELLQGLMDTDGAISYDDGRYNTTFFTSSQYLAEDFRSLCFSLGYSAKVREYQRDRDGANPEYIVMINIPNSEKQNLFTLPSKRGLAVEASGRVKRRNYNRVPIQSVEIMPYKEEMTCIRVDNEERLFLANDYIVTHNTFLTTCLTLPKHIEHNEPLMIMCNEEDVGTWKMQLTIWAANNLIRKKPEFKDSGVELLKGRFYDSQGGFTKEEWRLIDAAIEWLEERMESDMIKFVNFNSFSMDKAIGLVKKYTTQHNFKYFILDTMKLDNNIGSGVSDIAWLHLQQGMVKLYNVIKKSNKDVHVWLTYQLKKESRKYLDMDSLGMSKNVVDVVSTLILVRNVYDSEKEPGKLVVKGANGQPVILSEDKDYMLLFVEKNRRGSTDDVIVLGTDKNRNIIRDIGLTRIAEDF